MRFLERGAGRRRRTRLATVLATAGLMMVFQVILAIPAFAQSTCDFDNGDLEIDIDTGVTVTLEVTDGDDILLTSSDLEFTDEDTEDACLSDDRADLDNTDSISVDGADGDEVFEVVLVEVDDTGAPPAAGDLVDFGDINWDLDLGDDDADTLELDGALVSGDPVDVTVGTSGIDLDTDGDLDFSDVDGGIELLLVFGGDDDDTISFGGDATTGDPYPEDEATASDGADGDDTYVSGDSDDAFEDSGPALTDAFTGDEDTVDYSLADQGVDVDLSAGNADEMGDDDFDTDVTGGDATEVTGGSSVEDIVGSAFADDLTGDSEPNFITPGAGDDDIDGEGSEFDGATGDGGDELDYSDATAAVTIDMDAETATGGSGTDTWEDMESAAGSDFDDTFVDDIETDNLYEGGAGNDTFSQGADPDGGDEDSIDGEGGLDWIDYSARTENITVTLNSDVDDTDGCDGDITDPECADGDQGEDEADDVQGVENVRTGSGEDEIVGSSFANRIAPGDGADTVDGEGGGDTIDYSTSTVGVVINLAGGVTGEDAIEDVEHVLGSAFNDDITGTETANTLRAGKGNDTVRGSGGADDIKGGGGNDRVRAGSGDDNAKGGGGNDRLLGGSGDDELRGGKGKDFCKGGSGDDFIKGCEGKSKARPLVRQQA